MPSKKTKENQAVSFLKIFLEPDLIINFLICFATFHMLSFQSDLLRQDTCSQLALCSLRVCSVTSVMSDSLPPYGLQPTRLLWSMGFSRQDYWSRLPFHITGDLPDPGIELTFFALAGGFFITEPPGKSIQFSSVQFSRSVVSDSLRPMDYSPPSSSVYGILQARILELVAIPFSRRCSQPRDPTQFSCIGQQIL